MRYRFSYLLLLLSLSACTFQVDVLTPEPSVGLEFATATPPPIPTVTFSPTIISSPLPGNSGTYPIRFAPNGTYTDIVDSILVGTSKTYSIKALKGQVMSISVHQSAADNWTIIPIKIVGADGAILCPPKENTDCNFWRGVLPSSQDYFVTLTPVIDVLDFTMRVAINPPGMATQSFGYVSQNQKVTFSYTDEFAPVRYPDLPVTKFAAEAALRFINTQFHMETNLVEAYFLFGSSNDTDIVGGCLQVSSQVPNEQVVGNVSINGRQFVRSEGSGVAAGNFYEQIISRTVDNGTCYEVTFLIHSFSTGALPPQTVVAEYDRTVLLEKFEAILSTLVIK